MGAAGFEFTLNGEDQRNYRIEVSGDLQTWNTLTNFTSGNAVTALRDASTQGQGQRFYRAVTP
jgi:hypothetical protein